jgi:hypothetical protein
MFFILKRQPQYRAALNLSFEVLRGIQPERARELVDKMNDVIIGVALAPK